MTLPETLTFGKTPLSIVDRKGVPWLQARDVGRALGYARPDMVLRIFERNRDEFTKSMTATVELTVGITPVKVRIFSPRGCHLLAMFARTPRAKEFRRWVLDVLDRLALEEAKTRTKRLPSRPVTQTDLLFIPERRDIDRATEGYFGELYRAFEAARQHLRRARNGTKSVPALSLVAEIQRCALEDAYTAAGHAAKTFRDTARLCHMTAVMIERS